MKTATIPLVITPEAAAYIDELGVRRPFEQIIEHLRQTISGLHEIEVERQRDYDMGVGDTILICGYRDPLGLEDDWTDRNVGRWMRDTFPLSVYLQFVFFSVEEPRCAG